MKVNNKSSNKQKSSKMLIPGCMFIGIGIGLMIGQVAALTLIGLGIGMILSRSLNCGK